MAGHPSPQGDGACHSRSDRYNDVTAISSVYFLNKEVNISPSEFNKEKSQTAQFQSLQKHLATPSLPSSESQ